MLVTNNCIKKIAFFLPSLFGGGAEKTMLNLASGFADRGYKVDLVLVQAKGVYFDLFPENIRIVDLKASRSIMCFHTLIRYLRCERPNFMISALHINIIALMARNLSRVSTKVIVSERNTISHLAKNVSDLRFKTILKLARYFYPLADGIVAVSKEVAADLANTTGISNRRIQVIYNPVVTPLLRKKAKATIKHPWFKDNAPPVILAVGSLTIQKNFGLLIEAFANLSRTHTAHLVILGEGEKRNELEAQIKKYNLQHAIQLPGFVSNPYPYMVRSAVFVLSSRWEGLPGVLIEALYCGTPIVATDCPGGIREILSYEKSGTIVAVGDAKALSNAIKSVINGKESHPQRDSWQPFELETVVDQYSDLLSRI